MACNTCGDKPKECAGKHFPKTVVEINNPEQIVLFRKVSIPTSLGDETTVPPAIGKYHNVLLHYEATGANYIYSSDGIPTLLETEVPQEIYNQLTDLRTDVDQEVIDRENADTTLQGSITALDNSLATVAKSGDYTDLSNTPTIGDGTLTIKANGTTVGTFKANATTDTTASISFPEVDSTLSTSSSNAIANSAVSGAINKSVLTDVDLSANTSTTTVKLEGAKENLYSGATSTKNISFPVASSTQAGVMNSAIYDSITNNTNNINAVMSGAVAVSGLAASPAQSDLTAAWQSETGLSAIINRASIYDVTNQKVWTYYSNTSTWYAASNTSQVTVNPFTNLSAGTILGSQNIGQIFAEGDGTGSVNGWDTLTGNVSTNTSNISSLQTAVAGKQNTLTAGANIAIDSNTISATDTTYSAGTGLSLAGTTFAVDTTIIAEKSDIPTVNNATLTIQHNGTNVATFTANSSTDVTANITSPVITMTSTDPGEGNPLAAGQFIAVYS